MIGITGWSCQLLFVILSGVPIPFKKILQGITMKFKILCKDEAHVNMTIFLLVIIYLAFISLGLPDSLLGAAWPVMQVDIGAKLETAGLLFMTIASGTILSSLWSGR